MMLLQLFFLYVIICIVSNYICYNYGLYYEYRITPKKYIGKISPIYKFIPGERYEDYVYIDKYELLYTNNTYFLLAILIPYTIIISKLGYINTYKISVNKYKQSIKELGEKSYDELVLECETHVSESNNAKKEVLLKKESLMKLNKKFNKNFGK